MCPNSRTGQGHPRERLQRLVSMNSSSSQRVECLVALMGDQLVGLESIDMTNQISGNEYMGSH